jgi:hypothetical protein
VPFYPTISFKWKPLLLLVWWWVLGWNKGLSEFCFRVWYGSKYKISVVLMRKYRERVGISLGTWLGRERGQSHPLAEISHLITLRNCKMNACLHHTGQNQCLIVAKGLFSGIIWLGGLGKKRFWLWSIKSWNSGHRVYCLSRDGKVLIFMLLCF